MKINDAIDHKRVSVSYMPNSQNQSTYICVIQFWSMFLYHHQSS